MAIGVSVLLFLLSLVSGLPPLHAQTTEAKLAWLDSLPAQERQTRLFEAARNEGEAVIYGNLDVAAANALAEAFMRKYSPIKARLVHFSGASIITRVESEARAGKVFADVIDSGQLGVLALLGKNIMARYRSPQAALYREDFKDKNDHWTAYLTNVMVSPYNTRLVKKEELPTKLDDLLAPRWKDKLAMDSQSYVWFATIVQQMGQEAGLRFMRRLNDQRLKHIRGRRLLSQLVAAGEFDMAIESNLNSVLSFAKQGAPVWFAPIQPLFYSPSLVYFAQNAPHPHAGALFLDFLLSEDGQRVIASTDRIPANPRVKPTDAKILEGLDIRMPDIFDIGKRYDAIGRQYREIFPGAN